MKYVIIILLLITVGCGSKKEEPKEVRPETNIIRFLDSSGNVITVTTSGGESEVTINGERFYNGQALDTVLIPDDTGHSILPKSICIDTALYVYRSSATITNYAATRGYHIYDGYNDVGYNFYPQSSFPFIRISLKPVIFYNDSLVRWGLWGNFIPRENGGTRYIKGSDTGYWKIGTPIRWMKNIYGNDTSYLDSNGNVWQYKN